jgi:prepilin-type processing-associated H-X9-DG protein
MKGRHAFSLVELLVVTGICAILFAIFLPYLSKVRESERRVRCAENLGAILQGLHNYANANNHMFPRVTYDAEHNPNGYTAFTGAAAPDPFARGTLVSPNDVTASLFLLVRDGLVPASRFVCPSSSNSVDPMRAGAERVAPELRSNFTSGAYLSYSYACPFSSAPGYKMNDTQPADFALVADKNPGVSGAGNDVVSYSYDAPPFDLAHANSNNHRKAGQNVSYADGHVAFQTTPYCGVGQGMRRDNIYTALSPIPLTPGQRPPPESNGFYGRNIGPSWANDSYLVPTENEYD